MTIKQQGGVFGRNPTFNDVTIEGTLTFDGDIDINSDLKVNGDLEVTGDASIDDILLIGQDSGDAFNPDAILRLQRTGDRVFQQFKSDTDEVCAILFGDTSDDVRGQIEWDNSTDSLAFYTNNNDLAATFTSSGNLAFPSGQGIDFSATAGTGTSELLDDYEEGAWTPVVADASSGGNSASATVDGDYVKIGNSVTVSCAINNIDTTGLTSGNDVYIRGFPFVAKDMSTLGNNSGAIALSNITFSGYATLSLRDAQQYARISESSSGALNDFIVVSEIGSSADIYFSHTYITE